MVEVKLNHSNENPFYGLRNCLQLFQSATNSISESQLNACYNEVKDNKEKRELFFSLLFSIGDITARQHNIFKGVKKDWSRWSRKITVIWGVSQIGNGDCF